MYHRYRYSIGLWKLAGVAKWLKINISNKLDCMT